MTPHLRWGDDPDEMNFTSCPEQPYFPLTADLTRPAAPSDSPSRVSPILEFPVSITGSRLGDLLRSRFLLEHGQSLLKRAVRRGVRPAWLRPSTDDVDGMLAVCDTLVDRYASQGPVILVMFWHAGEVVPGATPYSLAPGSADRILQRIDDLLGDPPRARRPLLTMAEAGEHLRAASAFHSPRGLPRRQTQSAFQRLTPSEPS